MSTGCGHGVGPRNAYFLTNQNYGLNTERSSRILACILACIRVLRATLNETPL